MFDTQEIIDDPKKNLSEINSENELIRLILYVLIIYDFQKYSGDNFELFVYYGLDNRLGGNKYSLY